MEQEKGWRKWINSPVLMAFLLNAIFLILVLLFCDMKYEVSDDYVMDAILSGAYGTGYDEHLLFSNILLGYFLKFFYELIPVVSWYFVFQILVCFLSLWAVSYLVLEKNCHTVGILLSVLFVSFFSDDLYILVNFTKTAAVAAGAGGALFLYGFWNREKRKYSCIVLGGILAVIGSMIRVQCIYIALAFLFLSFLRYMWDCYRQDGWKILGRRALLGIVSCGLLVGIAFGVQDLNKAIWKTDSSYASFLTYNTRRASVTDTRTHGYESYKETLEQLGISETDYDMIKSWEFLDEDFFTEDLLDEVAVLFQDYHTEHVATVKYTLRKFWDRGYQTYVIVWGIAILFFLLLFLHPKQVPWELVGLGVCACLLLYFFWAGRAKYRVEYSIYVCMAINLVTAFHKTEISQTQKRVFIGLTALLCVLKIPLYIPDTSYQTMTDDEYTEYINDVFRKAGTFDIRKYRCDVNHRQPCGELESYIKADEEGYYLLDFNTAMQLVYYDFKPWIRVPMGYWQEYYSYLGGVTTGFPGNTDTWEEHGIDVRDPYKSIVNEGIYVVDGRHAHLKLAYLREQYYPNARMELVDTVNGMRIWKYYAE